MPLKDIINKATKLIRFPLQIKRLVKLPLKIRLAYSGKMSAYQAATMRSNELKNLLNVEQPYSGQERRLFDMPYSGQDRRQYRNI